MIFIELGKVFVKIWEGKETPKLVFWLGIKLKIICKLLFMQEPTIVKNISYFIEIRPLK